MGKRKQKDQLTKEKVIEEAEVVEEEVESEEIEEVKEVKEKPKKAVVPAKIEEVQVFVSGIPYECGD